MRAAIYILVIFGVELALAAGGGKNYDGVPTIVYWQLLNITMVLVGLHFLVRPAIVKALAGKKEAFLKAQEDAKAAFKAAESARDEVRDRLDQLEKTASLNVDQANHEAKQLIEKIKSETEVVANRVVEDAKSEIDRLVIKAKSEISTELLNKSFAKAEDMMRGKMKAEDQSRLQSEFSSRLQVVE